jgi:hypothetical protein
MAKCGAKFMPACSARVCMRRYGVLPPTRGASGIRNVGGAPADELPVLGRAGEHLAGGDRRVEPNLSRSKAPRWRD